MMQEQIGSLDSLVFRSLLGFCVAICALGPSLQAQATPKIITFDAPGAGVTGSTYVARMNSQGEIVGYFTDSNGVYPFFRMPNGLITSFNPVPKASTQSVASSINDDGVIAGTYASGPYRVGFLRATNGTITRLDSERHLSIAGLTNGGVIAGDALYYCGYQDPECIYYGYVRASDGTMALFSAPGASTYSQQGTFVLGLNANGTVVGYYTDNNSAIHGYVRTSDGTTTTIDVAGAGTAEYQGTYVIGATGKGIIAGDYVDGNGVYHGYVQEPSGTVRKFDVTGTMGGEGTYVTAMNGKGAITGDYADSSGVYHGYVRAPDGIVTRFDAPRAGTTAGGTFPVSINATGVIAGYYADGDGVTHGFVRTP